MEDRIFQRNWYILQGKEPQLVTDSEVWGQWFETSDRRVAFDKVGSVEISTVFVGLDLAYGYDLPILFETMVFNEPEYEGIQERYSTWVEAEAGHKKIVEAICRWEKRWESIPN